MGRMKVKHLYRYGHGTRTHHNRTKSPFLRSAKRERGNEKSKRKKQELTNVGDIVTRNRLTEVRRFGLELTSSSLA